VGTKNTAQQRTVLRRNNGEKAVPVSAQAAWQTLNEAMQDKSKKPASGTFDPTTRNKSNPQVAHPQ
jgi:hypothetical protein